MFNIKMALVAAALTFVAFPLLAQELPATPIVAAVAANETNQKSVTEVSVSGDQTRQYRRPVSTAYAANLTSGIDTCLGSMSGGAQAPIVGLSFGSTKVDKNCVMIKQVQLLKQLGYESAACFRARAGDEGKAIDAAMTQAGIVCESVAVQEVSTPAATPATEPVAEPTPAVEPEKKINQ